ncbi:MAG TPA: ABC transporter substrate-binding protein [Xanthobacteraceae bacterium]|jgi:NitT/TauT family transport system substrate-binding protein|nr:ABC transporter substrate-binding protein [Xanthobacteraceae bacterium]
MMLRRFAVSVATLCGLLLVLANGAQAETKVRFTLDWLPGSYHAPFFIALYKGYYKAEGLDVTIDRGKGSGQVVRQLATNVYDIGYPDINVLIEFVAKNPNIAFPEVMMGYEQNPSGLFFLKSSGIKSIKDLEGKTLGPVANDSTYKTLPVFAKLNNFDLSKVKVQFLEPALREALLIKGQVDAITGQYFRSVMDLHGRGVKFDDIGYFLYKDHGLDLYGNGVAVSPEFLKAHPDAVKGFVRATIKGAKDMIHDPQLAVDMVAKAEPLLNKELELERLKLALECCIATPNVRKNGYGGIEDARLGRSIELLSEGYELPRKPTVGEIFNGSFLPTPQERMIE